MNRRCCQWCRLKHAISFLLKEGQTLAKEEKLAEAIDKFKQVENLGGSLDIDPEVGKLVVDFLLEQGDTLGKEGELKESLQNYNLAKKINPELPAFDADAWARG